MINIFKDFDSLKNCKGVYVNNKAKNNDLYDRMWELQSRDFLDDSWGKSRIQKFLRFSGGNINFKDKVVLDACSGLGRFSIVAAELGAKFVCAADGSYVGPKMTHEALKNKRIPYRKEENIFFNNIINLNNLKNPLENFCFLQTDIEEITNVFNSEQFDVIIHHMALHHQRDYKKTLKDLSHLLKPNGFLIFNFFTDNDVPQITWDIREIFLNESLENTYEFLKIIGKLWHYEKKQKSLKDMLLVKDTKYSNMISGLKKLCKKYSIKKIEEALHLEDCITPYIWTYDPSEISYFVQSIGLKIVYSHPSPYTFIVTKISGEK